MRIEEYWVVILNQCFFTFNLMLKIIKKNQVLVKIHKRQLKLRYYIIEINKGNYSQLK